MPWFKVDRTPQNISNLLVRTTSLPAPFSKSQCGGIDINSVPFGFVSCRVIGDFGQSRSVGEVADNADEANDLSASVCLNTPARLLESFDCYRVRKTEGSSAAASLIFRPLSASELTGDVHNGQGGQFPLSWLYCRIGCLQECGIKYNLNSLPAQLTSCIVRQADLKR